MKRIRVSTILAGILLCVVSTVSRADLATYDQDFEGLLNTIDDQPAQVALANDGWKVFVNVFGPDGGYWYGYGVFPAPNGGFGGPAFSAVVAGQGGPGQGAQQLSVYSDYNNPNHNDGSNAVIETNVFQEQVIGAADVGKTWRFVFDAKRGNLDGASTALAFFKTLNPAAGYALTNFITVDLTGSTSTWENDTLAIVIDPSLVGQILQFGFLNKASNAAGSGIFYDNVVFELQPLSVGLDIHPGSCPNPINRKSKGVLPVAVLGAANFNVSDIDVASLRLAGVAPVRWGQEDVAMPFEGDLCGCGVTDQVAQLSADGSHDSENGHDSDDGLDGFLDLTLKFNTQAIINAIGSAPNGELVLTLTGTLLDGTPIEGQDCVVLVGKAPRPHVREGLAEPTGRRDGRVGVGTLQRRN